MISKIFTFLDLLLMYMLYGISSLIPKSSKILVFTGWHTHKEGNVFADNSKYMFLCVQNTMKDCTAVWIADDIILPQKLREQGHRAYYVYSLQGIYYSIRAGYTFVDAFMKRSHWRFSGGSKVIQLWHGKGMKKTGHDSPYSLSRYNRLLFPNLFTKFYRLIASSPSTSKLMQSTFKVSEDNMIVSGLPRNDIFFKDISGAEIDAHGELKDQIQKARSIDIEKIILYAPTFRTDGSNPLETLDFKVLNGKLKDIRAHMILSLHPKFGRKNFNMEYELSNISYISAGYDIYPYLKEIDMLITDYSSLYIDFLLLNRPIIFYTYDIDTYRVAMGLHDDFDRFTPGPHPKSFEELLKTLEEKDEYLKERERVRSELFTHNDGNSAERIASSLNLCK